MRLAYAARLLRWPPVVPLDRGLSHVCGCRPDATTARTLSKFPSSDDLYFSPLKLKDLGRTQPASTPAGSVCDSCSRLKPCEAVEPLRLCDASHAVVRANARCSFICSSGSSPCARLWKVGARFYFVPLLSATPACSCPPVSATMRVEHDFIHSPTWFDLYIVPRGIFRGNLVPVWFFSRKSSRSSFLQRGTALHMSVS